MAKADSLLRLRVETKEYDDKLKRAAEGIQHLAKAAHDMGGSFTQLDKSEVEFVRNLGDFNTVSKTASGQARELNNAFVNLSATYKQFSEEEKNDESGRALASSLEKIRKRAADANEALAKAKEELGSVNNAMSNAAGDTGDFSNVLGQLGSKLGINSELMGVLRSGTLATTAAVTAGAAAVAAATKMWADYNDEMNRQTSMTKVVTGLDGSEAEDMVVSVRSLAKTYDVDFRQAIDTANTLMHQFGLSGEKSVQLLRDGMQGMIAGDGPKLLSMIQQFAPAFVDAGISADKLVAIIHNSEGGLFSEQNMNAILMGIKNIRLMTKATSDALAQMGIDGEEMSRKMSDGSMTVFEALQQVAEALEKANAGSREAGQVMQSVFGRQGAMQGMKLARAIAELNTNLEETKTQTGELGQSLLKLNQANELLENTMKETFGVKGWEDMSNQLKTDLALALADIVKWLGDVKTAITEIGTEKGFDALADALRNSVIPGLMAVGSGLKEIKGLIADIAGWNNNTSMGDRISNFRSQYDELKKMFGDGLKVEVKEVDGKVVSAHKWVQGKKVDITEEYLKREAERNQQQQPPKNNNDNKPVRTPKVKTQQTEEQLNTAKIQAYQQEYITASDEMRAAIREEIKTLQDRNKEIQRLKDEAAGTLKIDIEYPEGSLQSMEAELKRLKDAQGKALDNYEWVAYQQSIDETTRKISLFKNELPKGEQATFTLNVDDKQLEELRRSGLFDDKTIRVNVEQGRVDLPNIPTDDETIKVNVEQGRVDLPNIPTDDETIKVNVEQGRVELPNIPTDDETIKVNVEPGDVELPEIPTGDETIKVNVEQGEVDLPDIPKDETYTLTIAADTTAAMEKVNELVRNIEHQQPVIQPKVEMASNLETIKMNIAEAMNAKDLKIDSNTYTNLLQTAIRNGIDSLDGDFSELQAKMGMGINIPDDTWQRLQDELNEQLAELDIEPIKIDFKTGDVKSLSADAKGVEKSFSAAAQAVQSVGSALQGLEDPGAKVAGIVAQAIAQIALGFAQATAESSGAGIFGWIAAIAGGLATMVSTINAIHSATGYAEGGVIQGNSYSGDNQWARVNAGEVILNRAQVGNLAAQLEGASGQGVTAQPYVNGEQIWLGLSNYLRRSGRGEVVTSRR